MKNVKSFCLLLLLVAGFLYGFSAPEKEREVSTAVLLYTGTPNPTEGKCLIRFYLPENDPEASLKIIYKEDNGLVKEIPLSGVKGINSALIDFTYIRTGTYVCQLFYKNESRSEMVVVNH